MRQVQGRVLSVFFSLVALSCTASWSQTASERLEARVGIGKALVETIDDDHQRSVSGLPLAPTRELAFTTTEGTWISLDVSPDGSTIVFDLLGDLFLLEEDGGYAAPLTSGMPYDRQPRFSPDGSKVVFVSDRDGSSNVWLVDIATKLLTQVSREYWVQFVSPEWSSKGDAVFVSRYSRSTENDFTGLVSDIEGELVKYDIARGTEPEQVFDGNNREFGTVYSGPALKARDSSVYLSLKKYERDKVTRILRSDRRLIHIDRLEDAITYATSSEVRVLRARASPNERYLAYISDPGGATGVDLKLRNIETGDEKTLVRDLGAIGGQVAHDNLDNYPGFAFTPDGKYIVVSGKGAIWKVNALNGAKTNVPFVASIRLDLGPKFAVKNTLRKGVIARDIRNAELSPDGSKIAFSAFGKVWVHDFRTEDIRRVSNSSSMEDLPSWSPDGTLLSYRTYSENSGGHLFTVPSDLRSPPQTVTVRPAFYLKPVFSPDSKSIAVTFGRTSEGRLSKSFSELSVGVLSLRTGIFRELSELKDDRFVANATLRFDRSGCRIIAPIINNADLFHTGLSVSTSEAVEAESVECGSFPSKIDVVELSNSAPFNPRLIDIVSSPDGTRLLARAVHGLYFVVLPRPIGSYETINFNDLLEDANTLVRQITPLTDVQASWSADGSRFQYTDGRRVHSFEVDDASEAWSLGQAYMPRTTDINTAFERKRPDATIVFRGARLITMKGDEVIEHGDLVVRNNEIVALGESGAVSIPPLAHIVDASGKTIIPGLVDLHAHTHTNSFNSNDRSSPVFERLPSHLAYLSFGVTTVREAGFSDLAYVDLSGAGLLIGPRIISMRRVKLGHSSFEDFQRRIQQVARENSDQGLKIYEVGPRVLRQWAISAALSANVLNTIHIGNNFDGLTAIVDGYPGVEHFFGSDSFHFDLIQLFARSGVVYTPTLAAVMRSEWETVEEWRRADLEAEPRLRRFVKPSQFFRASKNFTRVGLRNEHGGPGRVTRIARSLKEITQAGGSVGIGGHGDFPGIDTHVEMRVVGRGGLSNHEILRSATQVGADAIGLGHELGSLVEGKLADLVILNENPLDDIRHSANISLVMRDGELFEAETLAQIWPHQVKAPKLWWHEENGNGF